MRKIQVILAFLLAIGLCQGCANTGSVKRLKKTGEFSEENVSVSMKTPPEFHSNKRFIYLIAWNGIPVGRIVTEVKGIIRYKERDVYEVVLVTESNKFLSKIYRVEDTYTSYVDVMNMTSRRYEADRKEGNYRKHLVVEYDFDEREAIYTNLTDGSVNRYPIKDNVQDPLSAMCYFMTLPVSLGDKIEIIVNLNGKNYDLYGQVESIDMIKLPEIGSFPAFKIRPYALLKGKEVKKGKGWMYFSADKDRLPLYGVVRIPFGKVTATLRTVEDIS